MNLCQNEANKSTSPWGSKSQQQEVEEEKGRWETAPSFPRFRPLPRPFEICCWAKGGAGSFRGDRKQWTGVKSEEQRKRRCPSQESERTFLYFTFSFYSVQFKAFAVRSDSKHYSDVQKSWASHHFFIFCFQAVRLLYFLKCSWATVLSFLKAFQSFSLDAFSLIFRPCTWPFSQECFVCWAA